MRTSVIFALSLLLILPAHVNAADITWAPADTSGRARIYIEGKIAGDDPIAFHKAVIEIEKLGLTPTLVVIYSPGGNVAAALDIGRRIRLLGLDTGAPSRWPGKSDAILCERATYDHSGRLLKNPRHWSRNMLIANNNVYPDDRCICASACFLIWAAGGGRVGDWIGVHRPSRTDTSAFGALPRTDAIKEYDEILLAIDKYLVEMGVPSEIRTKMAETRSTTISYLTYEESKRMLSGAADIEYLIARCGDFMSDVDGMRKARERNDNKMFAFFRAKFEEKTPCSFSVTKELFQKNFKKYTDQFGSD